MAGARTIFRKVFCHLKTNSASLRSVEKLETRVCTPCNRYISAWVSAVAT